MCTIWSMWPLVISANITITMLMDATASSQRFLLYFFWYLKACCLSMTMGILSNAGVSELHGSAYASCINCSVIFGQWLFRIPYVKYSNNIVFSEWYKDSNNTFLIEGHTWTKRFYVPLWVNYLVQYFLDVKENFNIEICKGATIVMKIPVRNCQQYLTEVIKASRSNMYRKKEI